MDKIDKNFEHDGDWSIDNNRITLTDLRSSFMDICVIIFLCINDRLFHVTKIFIVELGISGSG